MLCLRRKLNEEIVIAGSIKVSIADIRGEKVVLGITAPEHVSVHRAEVQAKVIEQAQGLCSPEAIDLMEDSGGSFARAMAVAWRRADPANRILLELAFAELYAPYEAEVSRRRRITERAV